MVTKGTTDECVDQLCKLAKHMVTPEKVIEVVDVPYDPDKCAAKSAAAMLGIAIPQLSKLCGSPLLELGGFRSVWTGTHYEPLTDAQMSSVIKAFATGARLLKPSILTSDFAREFDKSFSAHGKPSSVFGFGARPIRGINYQDGVLTVRDGKECFISGHRPEDLTTYCIPAKWKLRSEDKTWQKFLDESVPCVDTRQYLLGMFGNAIAGDPMNAQKIMLLIGAAGAGKSTLIEAIVGCIGSQNVMRTDNLAQITRDDSRHRMRLAHATLCVSADASENIGDKDALKMIVSKEPIIARKLYSEPLEITPRACLVVASNEMGLSYVLSDPGVARRFDIISFKKAKDWRKRDIALHEKLATEKAKAGIGISLGLCLLEEVKRGDGKLERPGVVEKEIDRLRIEGDPFMSWMVASGLSADPDVQNSVEIHQDRAHESFKSYCANSGYNAWSIRRFKARLRALNLEEQGRHGGKHAYYFYVKDMNLAKLAQVVRLI
jgi:phage/plasmid-associated DNA primase